MHEHGQEQKSENAARSGRHLFIMLLCCLIPIAILVVLVTANIDSAYLPFLLVLLCPLMMILLHLPRMLPAKKKTEKPTSSLFDRHKLKWYELQSRR